MGTDLTPEPLASNLWTGLVPASNDFRVHQPAVRVVICASEPLSRALVVDKRSSSGGMGRSLLFASRYVFFFWRVCIHLALII